MYNKKLFACFLAGTLALTNMPIAPTDMVAYAAEDINSSVETKLENFNYTKDSNTGDITITKYKGSASTVDLTTIFGDDKVKTIADNAFWNNDNLREIVIPASVSTIGNFAFGYCNYLGTVTLGESSKLTSIGNGAFYQTNLTAVTIPASVSTIGKEAFFDCQNLKTVTFEEGSKLTSIGSAAFCRTNLTEVAIPSSVSIIGEEAFRDCSNLTTVTFKNDSKLKTIGNSAFFKTNLTEVVIPSSVSTIGEYAFSECNNLQAVTFGDNSKLTILKKHTFDKNTNLQTVTFGNNSQLTTIGDYAFYQNTKLKTVTFGDNSQLTTIGDSAFQSTKIQEIALPDTVTSIGNSAFKESALTSITIPASCTDICAKNTSDNYGAFAECSALKTVIFKNNKNSENSPTVGVGTFYNCTKLSTVELPEGLTNISSSTFRGCTALSKIIIPSAVENIGENAFYECSALSNVTFKSANTEISNRKNTISGSNNLVICCDLKENKEQSEAETYARKYSIRFARPAKELSITKEPQKELFYGDAITADTLTTNGITLEAEFDSTIEPSKGEVSIKDCFISGYDAQKIGKQDVTITYGTASTRYPVTVYYDFSKASISTIQSETYTGKAIEPELKVAFSVNGTSTTLEKDKDYTVSYSEDHTNKGQVKVTLTGKGDFKGTITKTFNITQKSLSADDVKVQVGNTTYNPTAEKPELAITYGDLILKEGTDYSLTYGTNKTAGEDAGSVTITAKSDSNYTGSKTVRFDIAQKDISELTIPDLEAVVYNGEKQNPLVSISWEGYNELKEGSDYELLAKDNLNVTTNASVIIRGIGNYTGEVTKNFTISHANIEEAVLTKSIDYEAQYGYFNTTNIIEDNSLSYDYTGNAITPNVFVYYNFKQLKKGTDYNITYYNNTNADGDTYFTIEGIGNFTGEKTIHFTIKPNPAITPTPSPTPDVTPDITSGGSISGGSISGGSISGGSVIKPDGTVIAPDGTVTKPDGTVTKPDGTVTKPDGTVTKPDGTVTKPDGTVTKPDGTVTKPDGTIIDPDGTITILDGTVIAPDGIMTKPDGTVVEPDSVTKDANGNTIIIIYPDGTTIKPDGTMTTPDDDSSSTAKPDEDDDDTSSTAKPDEDDEDTSSTAKPDEDDEDTSSTAKPGEDNDSNVNEMKPATPGATTGTPTPSPTPTIPPTKAPATTGNTTTSNTTTNNATVVTNPTTNTTTTEVTAKKVSITSCKNNKGKKLIAKWKKQAGVAGYEITIATNKKFTANKQTKTTTKTSYTFKKLKKGKTYFVRVRAYVMKDKKKDFGSYSQVKKVVIKK